MKRTNKNLCNAQISEQDLEGIEYLVPKWQGFIKQLLNKFSSSGFFYYHVVELPEKKRDKWRSIDQKLLMKYKPMSNLLSKDQTFRLRQKKAVFYYLRWDKYAIFLHTSGEFDRDLKVDDKFHDVRKEPLKIKVGKVATIELYTYKVEGGKDAYSARLESASYSDIKAGLAETIRVTKNPALITKRFKALNNLPRYHGINSQKFKLRDFALRECRKHQVDTEKVNFHVRTFLEPVKVFEDQNETA